MEKLAAGALANDRRVALDITWEAIATALQRPPVWVVAAVLGYHPMPEVEARAVSSMLGLGEEAVAAMRRQPYRTSDDSLRQDPTIYRFYELLQVYGPALKELIHENFGDGIMSAINCKVEVTRRTDPDGDRVHVTIDGKFLAYQW